MFFMNCTSLLDYKSGLSKQTRGTLVSMSMITFSTSVRTSHNDVGGKATEAGINSGLGEKNVAVKDK